MNRLSLLLATALLGATLPAFALDMVEIVRKAKAYSVPAPTHVESPGAGTIEHLSTPPALLDLVPRSDRAEAPPRGACERNGNSLCYDMDSKRVVYRPIRKYMPTIDGLKPENISLKRDAIVFKYSFR